MKERVRNLASFGIAGGIVSVDSASRIVSMVGDLILVALLLAVLMIRKK